MTSGFILDVFPLLPFPLSLSSLKVRNLVLTHSIITYLFNHSIHTHRSSFRLANLFPCETCLKTRVYLSLALQYTVKIYFPKLFRVVLVFPVSVWLYYLFMMKLGVFINCLYFIFGSSHIMFDFSFLNFF